MKKASAVKFWLCVTAGFACIITAYFFAIRAARAVEIREVPLAPTRGTKP